MAKINSGLFLMVVPTKQIYRDQFSLPGVFTCSEVVRENMNIINIHQIYRVFQNNVPCSKA